MCVAAQSTETLRAMARETRKAEVERQEKRRAASAERRENEQQHTN